MDQLDLKSDLTPEQMANPQTNEEVYNGSIGYILQHNIGFFCICEFLIGNSIVVKHGTIYSVGINFFVLYQEENRTYIVCDLYSVKFITFFNTGSRPKNMRLPQS